MKISQRFDGVTGDIDTETQEVVCVQSYKHKSVELAFKGNFNVPFAKIKLFSSDRYVDAEATFEGAGKLGEEIARRWNAGLRSSAEPEAHEDLAKISEMLEEGFDIDGILFSYGKFTDGTYQWLAQGDDERYSYENEFDGDYFDICRDPSFEKCLEKARAWMAEQAELVFKEEKKVDNSNDAKVIHSWTGPAYDKYRLSIAGNEHIIEVCGSDNQWRCLDISRHESYQ